MSLTKDPEIILWDTVSTFFMLLLCVCGTCHR